MDYDVAAFRDFEATGWEEVADGYATSDVVASFAAQFAPALADGAAAGADRHVLDLACGPGFAAEAAVARGATAVGLDLSANMVAAAQRRVPRAEFHQGPAEALPFDDGEFDGVMCGLGLPHFVDPVAVFTETYRVLKPGGRMAFTTWNTPDRVPFFGVIFAAVVEHGSLDVPLPDGPDMFRFADEAEATSTLEAVGFREVGTVEVPAAARVTDAAQAMDMVTRATVRTRALFEAQAPAAQEAIAAAVTAEIESMRQGSTIEVPMPAFLITAQKP